MSFNAAEMLVDLYSDPAPKPAAAAAVAALSVEAPAECEDDNNATNWQAINDADRAYLLGPRSWPAPCPWCGGRLTHSATCNYLRREWVPIMPFGKHRGRRADELPSEYIDWVLTKCIGSQTFREQLLNWREST